MKKVFQFIGFVAMVLAFFYPEFTYSQIKVGDLHEGGIVFFVNSTGTHGLVAANIDQYEKINWYNAHDELNNPARHDSEGKEYFDWRLPTKYELNLMFTNLDSAGLGNLASKVYWSSTEVDYALAWRRGSRGSKGFGINKNFRKRVRAIRTF